MLINRFFPVRTSDLGRFAWSNLRKFHNTDFVEELILNIHRLPKKHRQNVRKQAKQLRHCLLQAREYFAAGEVVTLATRPTLYYYGAMSLALAEILLKQTGDSSLDRAREHHKHHGLMLRVDGSARSHMHLQLSASLLVATPLEVSGARRGTFDLWHRSARNLPAIGEVKHIDHAASTSRSTYEIVGVSEDMRLPLTPLKGLSLFDCLRRLPCMTSHLMLSEIWPDLVRAKIEVRSREKTREFHFRLHPTSEEVFDRVSQGFAVKASDIYRLAIQEMDERLHMKAAIIRFVSTDAEPVRFRFPSSTMWDVNQAFFGEEGQPLNEFGYFYVSLYILGNYARYYPDMWMEDVERGTPLALAAEELLSAAAARVPLCILSELSRTYFVPEL